MRRQRRIGGGRRKKAEIEARGKKVRGWMDGWMDGYMYVHIYLDSRGTGGNSLDEIPVVRDLLSVISDLYATRY